MCSSAIKKYRQLPTSAKIRPKSHCKAWRSPGNNRCCQKWKCVDRAEISRRTALEGLVYCVDLKIRQWEPHVFTQAAGSEQAHRGAPRRLGGSIGVYDADPACPLIQEPNLSERFDWGLRIVRMPEVELKLMHVGAPEQIEFNLGSINGVYVHEPFTQ